KLQGILLKERPNAILGCEKGRNLVLFTIGFKRFSRMETYPGVYLTTRVAKIIHWLKVKVLYRRSTIIAISHGIKQAFVEKYGIPPENVVVIYNPCDLSKIRTLSEEPLEPELIEIFKNPVILNVGRIVKGKGQWHLIRAFSLISKEYPDSRLVIVGDGLLRGYLEKLIKGLGLEGKVFILGFKPNPFKYMKGAFLFAFPSLVEGCPNVLIEALACRLPVIAADCPSGPREILNPGTRRAELRLPEYGKYGILMPVMDGKFYSANDPLTWQEEVWASEIIKCLETPKSPREI
ncbi:MAG: glycosyltransferase, partial [Nitrososphaerota archaeon]